MIKKLIFLLLMLSFNNVFCMEGFEGAVKVVISKDGALAAKKTKSIDLKGFKKKDRKESGEPIGWDLDEKTVGNEKMGKDGGDVSPEGSNCLKAIKLCLCMQ